MPSRDLVRTIGNQTNLVPADATGTDRTRLLSASAPAGYARRYRSTTVGCDLSRWKSVA